MLDDLIAESKNFLQALGLGLLFFHAFVQGEYSQSVKNWSQ